MTIGYLIAAAAPVVLFYALTRGSDLVFAILAYRAKRRRQHVEPLDPEKARRFYEVAHRV